MDVRGFASSGPPVAARCFDAKTRARLVGDLGAKRTNIGDLPRLDHLPETEVGDHCLVDPKAASRPLDTAEAARHRARHHYARHFDLSIDRDLLHVVS